MVAASSGSVASTNWDASPSGSTGEASEEAAGVTQLVNVVLSRLEGLVGLSGDSGRFWGIPFGLSFRKVAHSGLMGVSSVVAGCVGLPTVRVASVAFPVMSGSGAGASMMRSGCASVISMSGVDSLVLVGNAIGDTVGNAIGNVGHVAD